MTRNPIINAASASGYILLVVAIMNTLSRIMRDKPDTIFAPITMLSLLVLSVVVMAFIFFYQPFQLFLDGKKKQALNLFVQTVGVFAAITTSILLLVFSGLV